MDGLVMADGAGYRNNMEYIEDKLTISVDALRSIREMALSKDTSWIGTANDEWLKEADTLLIEIMDAIGEFSDCAVGLDRIGAELERVHIKVASM